MAERPGWVEKVLVLATCAGLLVAVANLDERSARRQAARDAQTAQHPVLLDQPPVGVTR